MLRPRSRSLHLDVRVYIGVDKRFDQGGTVTFGFPQGRSDYEPEPEVPLGYVGHGFKQFSRDRDRLESVGLVAPFVAPAV
jgi:hypothetical protein